MNNIGLKDVATLSQYLYAEDQYGVEMDLNKEVVSVTVTNINDADKDGLFKVVENGAPRLNIEGAERGDKFTATFVVGNQSLQAEFTVIEQAADTLSPIVEKAKITKFVEGTTEESTTEATVTVKQPQHGSIPEPNYLSENVKDAHVFCKVIQENGKGVYVEDQHGNKVSFSNFTGIWVGSRPEGYQGYKGQVSVGGIFFNVEGVVPGDTFEIVTVAETKTTVTKPGSTTVTLTFNEAIDNGPKNDFELFIKGEKVTTTVTTKSTDEPNVLTLTINKDLTTDLKNGVQLKAASTIDIKDKAGNALNLSSGINLK